MSATGRAATSGKLPLAGWLCWLSFLLLAGAPLQAQENPPAQTQPAPAGPEAQPERPEISDDPTFIRTNVRGVLEEIHFANGAILDRLRIRYVQTLGKRDAVAADLPLGRVDPGSGFSSAYGTGDLALQYVHLFVAKRHSILQAGGALGVLKTASTDELGGSSGSLGGVYAISWRGSPRYQPYLVAQYLHSLRENTGVQNQSLLSLRPVLAFGIAHGWFASAEFRGLKQLDQERKIGMTAQASVGWQRRHWRAVGGYERAINDTSEQVIYRSRMFVEFGYAF